MKFTVRGACPEVGEADAVATNGLFEKTYSYAPISGANPWGMGVPARSWVRPTSMPASIAGEEDWSWKFSVAGEMKRGSASREFGSNVLPALEIAFQPEKLYFPEL